MKPPLQERRWPCSRRFHACWRHSVVEGIPGDQAGRSNACAPSRKDSPSRFTTVPYALYTSRSLQATVHPCGFRAGLDVGGSRTEGQTVR